jgi:large subunit ribosomal protein L6
MPGDVTVEVKADHLVVTGKKGELTSPIPPGISVEQDKGEMTFSRASEDKQTRAYHGLARALAANAVTGVSEGFRRELEVRGIGYKAAVQGSTLNMALGFSHPVEFPVPDGLQIQTPEPTKIIIEGIDKQLVGETAAQIRRIRPPDAYKGKGIRYSDEIVRTKVGKAGVAAG